MSTWFWTTSEKFQSLRKTLQKNVQTSEHTSVHTSEHTSVQLGSGPFLESTRRLTAHGLAPSLAPSGRGFDPIVGSPQLAISLIIGTKLNTALDKGFANTTMMQSDTNASSLLSNAWVVTSPATDHVEFAWLRFSTNLWWCRLGRLVKSHTYEL